MSQSFTIIDGKLEGYSADGSRLIVPEGVVKIENCSFWVNQRFKEIILPRGLLEIGEGAFKGFSVLEGVRLPVGLLEIQR